MAEFKVIPQNQIVLRFGVMLCWNESLQILHFQHQNLWSGTIREHPRSFVVFEIWLDPFVFVDNFPHLDDANQHQK